MPENTPIYGFTYPCPGDPVDATDFQTLATQIDAALASLAVDENWALGRYSVRQTMTPSQAGLVQGVETVLSNANSTYVIPADGVYVASAELRLTPTTSCDSVRLRLRRNGVAIPGRVLNTASAFATGAAFVVPSAPFVCAAGDTLSAAVLWFGVGTGTASLVWQVRMIVRIL